MEIVIFFLGIVTGSIGYVLINFVMQPILKYREIKYQVAADLVYYANAINTEGLNEFMQKQQEDRRISNRKHSSQLLAIYPTLPFFYKWWLSWKKESPTGAAGSLMGLSNTSDFEGGQQNTDIIKKHLNL